MIVMIVKFDNWSWYKNTINKTIYLELLKLSKNNTIITKPYKDTWNKEAVIKLCKKWYLKGVNQGHANLNIDKLITKSI